MSQPRQVTIAVDAMGGDHAPGINIRGAAWALKDSPQLSIVLVGDETQLKSEMSRCGVSPSDRLSIVHASEVITMDDHAGSAMRKKKNSSIHLGINMVNDQKADAFISAGNSGAVMGVAFLKLGRLPGVERPAIIFRLPHAKGWSAVLDGGANVDCKPSQLEQFALMGSVFVQVIEGIASPRVGLLSNGSESHKGNEVTRAADERLRELPINYHGYIEGRDVYSGEFDVIVCDGFVGNVLLKATEGVADTCFEWFRNEVRKDFLALAGTFLLRRVLKRFRNRFDYQPYGAAPLLGINGLVLISHGGSTDLAIRNGILSAQKAVEQEFLSKIGAQMDFQLDKAKQS